MTLKDKWNKHETKYHIFEKYSLRGYVSVYTIGLVVGFFIYAIGEFLELEFAAGGVVGIFLIVLIIKSGTKSVEEGTIEEFQEKYQLKE